MPTFMGADYPLLGAQSARGLAEPPARPGVSALAPASEARQESAGVRGRDFILPGLGLALAAFGKGSASDFGAGLAGGSAQYTLNDVLQKRKLESEQEQNLIKNVDREIQELGELGGLDNPQVQQAMEQYSLAMQDGKLTGKEAAKIHQQILSAGDLYSLKRAKKDELDFAQKQRVAEMESRLRQETMVERTLKDGTTVRVPASTAFTQESITGRKPPVIRQISDPQTGRPTQGLYDPETQMFTPIVGGTLSVRDQFKVYTDPETNQQTLLTVPTTFSGGRGGGTPTLPAPPQAAGPAPEGGLPPPPSSPAGINLGGKRPVVDVTTQQSLAGLGSAYSAMNRIGDLLNSTPTQGPALGRVTMAQIESLGGMGVDPKTIQLAVELRKLMANKAFEMGGKQLTDTEKVEFQFQVPSITDTVEQAFVKARADIAAMQRSYANRLMAMHPAQRAQYPKTLNEFSTKAMESIGGGLPPPPTSQSGMKRKTASGIEYEVSD